MRNVLELYLEIAVLRARPQQLPASRAVLAVVLVVHLAIGTLFALFEEPLAFAFATAAAMTLMMAAVSHALLMARQRTRRFNQTLSALAGCDVVIALVALPLRVWAFGAGEEPLLQSFVVLLVIIWSVAVASHIFRYALDLTSGPAVLVAFGYMVTSYAIAGLMMPRME